MKKSLLILLVLLFLVNHLGQSQIPIYGCTDPMALNYSTYATHDNGSCAYTESDLRGCTDRWASNYKRQARYNDGSCVYPEVVIVGCKDPLALNYDRFATIDTGYICAYENTVYGCTYPWSKNYNPAATLDNGTCFYYYEGVLGCTHSSALNYNQLATMDDGSCVFANLLVGCTDPVANNYDPLAYIDSGNCEYDNDVWGCTNPKALNYDPLANKLDGNCLYSMDNRGCIDKLAMNYNPFVLDYDRSCVYSTATQYGCTDPYALNYNRFATIDIGNCAYSYVPNIAIYGCTDPNAKNFNPLALSDNGDCVYDVEGDLWGCTDPKALNYNPNVTTEDHSCLYAKPINTFFTPIEEGEYSVVSLPATYLCELDFSIPMDYVYCEVAGQDSEGYVVRSTIKQKGKQIVFYNHYQGGFSSDIYIYLSVFCKGVDMAPYNSDILKSATTAGQIKGIKVGTYLRDNIITGIKEKQESTILLYPNPASDMLNFKGEFLSGKNRAALTIFSQDGKVALKTEIVKSNNVFAPVDISNLKPGVYVVKAQADDNAVVAKLIRK